MTSLLRARPGRWADGSLGSAVLASLIALFLLSFPSGPVLWAQDFEAKAGEAPPTARAAQSTRAVRAAAYRARADSVVDFFAGRLATRAPEKGNEFDVAASLYEGENMDAALARLDTLMKNPSGDMFWMYPMTLLNFVGRDVLPASYRERLRRLWRTYTPYRGDTENHWAMYYTSLYLMTQLYPDDPPERWFNGKSSAENHREAREYLLHWMDRTTRLGQGEFDSPHYMNFYVAPMALLYAFAEDPAIRQRAQMMLDYLLADFAAESLNGMYVGAFSRIYPDEVVNRWTSNSTAYAWLLFGNTPFRARGGSLILALSGYQPPAVLYPIGTDRAAPYVHRERKRTRRRIRYSDQRMAPVYKYTFMAEDYAVGSIQGGLLQPIQQHTWEVFWEAEDPKRGYNMLFTLHPYASPKELAMYFPEEPEMLTEAVIRSKSTYGSPDKWTGASPHEQVFQHRDALVALYDIPEGTRFPHISGFFPKTLARREEGGSGWIFAKGGDALIAYYPLAPYEWREEEEVWRLHSPHRRNGAVVQVAPARTYASFEAFKTAVKDQPLDVQRTPTPQVRFEALGGDVLAFTYGETPTLNGDPIDHGDWPLFGGPFMHAEVGSNELLLRHGQLRRRLDFAPPPTITDRVVPEEPSAEFSEKGSTGNASAAASEQ